MSQGNMSFQIGNDDNRANVVDIKVIGVGGGGGNAVARMHEQGLDGVEFSVINTDLQALRNSPVESRLQIGVRTTSGLGCGGNHEQGRKAIEENREDVEELLEGTDMVFITAGLGGGTGTGAAPVLADIAKKDEILTVAVVTTPFHFEGSARLNNAKVGLEQLENSVDTLIVIPNQRLLSVVEEDTPLTDAFRMADNILHQATRGISDLITEPGLINLDFADVKGILMDTGGDALMGTGTFSGENRAIESAQAAISSPLLESVSIEGAQGVIINITGGQDMSLQEVNEAASLIQNAAGEEANVIFGSVIDPELEDEIQITVIAAGFERKKDVSKPTKDGSKATIVNLFGEDNDGNEKEQKKKSNTAVQGSSSTQGSTQNETSESQDETASQESPSEKKEARMNSTFKSPNSDSDLEVPTFLRKQENS